jgi:hypothetical protein
MIRPQSQSPSQGFPAHVARVVGIIARQPVSSGMRSSVARDFMLGTVGLGNSTRLPLQADSQMDFKIMEFQPISPSHAKFWRATVHRR